MKTWEKFKAWDERFEAEHPRLYGLLTAATGIVATAAAMALVLMVWAVVK